MLKINFTVTRNKYLISIQYKYKHQKDLTSIAEEDEGSINSSILYVSNYADHFSYVAIIPVSYPLVMYNLFRYVNGVDSHNKYRKSSLGM